MLVEVEVKVADVAVDVDVDVDAGKLKVVVEESLDVKVQTLNLINSKQSGTKVNTHPLSTGGPLTGSFVKTCLKDRL